ncbi:hypothetical protein CHS0354_002548 [Potamilus streckersoni]|uniref:Angio-associated migratory cell protein n=1 Tax=Potamilus streckersoni TaxID=2493646 RepID=A0AAE0S7U9_9BIVA|nr:hypothetical protein CHS0354_002548 [Potamilus streckersoni]
MKGNIPPAEIDSEDDINEEDIVEIIELDDNDAVLNGMEHIGLDQDGEEEQNSDDMEGAEGQIVKDDSDLVFDKHKGSVFCVSIDPKSCDLVLTGGQDDTAFVWKISTGEIIFECTGHMNSVTCAGFSYDGKYVATWDLSGFIKVWKVETKQKVWSSECWDIQWLQWHPSAHVLLAGTVAGDVWMWKIPDGDCRTFLGPDSTTSCGKILPDGKRVAAGFDSGIVKIWDLKSGSILHNISGHDAHQSAVICMDCHQDNNLIITGSTDVTAKLISSSTGKVIGTLDCSQKGSGIEEEDSVESVGFSNMHNYAATGTMKGYLSIWDVSTQICRHTCKHERGIVKLSWARESPLVYTISLDNVIRLWDIRNGQPVASWTGHEDFILDFAISQDNNFLVSASDDRTARVFSIYTPGR